MGRVCSQLPDWTCHILRGHPHISFLFCTFWNRWALPSNAVYHISSLFPHHLCWLFPLCLDTCSSSSCHNSNCVLATVPLFQSLDSNTHHPPCVYSFLPLLILGKCPAVTGFSFPPLGCSSHHSTGAPTAASRAQPCHRLKDILLLEGTQGMWGCITHGHSHCWWLLSWSHLFLDAPWSTSFFEEMLLWPPLFPHGWCFTYFYTISFCKFHSCVLSDHAHTDAIHISFSSPQPCTGHHVDTSWPSHTQQLHVWTHSLPYRSDSFLLLSGFTNGTTPCLSQKPEVIFDPSLSLCCEITFPIRSK